jgi:hypothetical protein
MSALAPNKWARQWGRNPNLPGKEKGKSMSKKMMLLALAAFSAALFALPAVASAQEIHMEPGNGESFTVTGGAGELRAESEPTITCEHVDGSGKFDAGSSTTGTIHLDFTGCHATVFGLTAKCRTKLSALDNTITTEGTFHLITTTAGTPDILVTPNPTEIVCAGISNVTVTGTVIGTITAPKCGESSKTMTMAFSATGSTQNDLTYTGNTYDLKAYTGSTVANEKTAGLVGTSTATSANAQKLNCT